MSYVENMFLPLNQVMSPCHVNKIKSFTKKCDNDEKLKLILRATNYRTTTYFLLFMLNNFSHNKVTSAFCQIK